MTKILKYETAGAVIHYHQELKRSTDLLDRVIAYEKDPKKEPLLDAFGRLNNSFQLGVPSGSSGHSIMSLSPELAKIIIEAHIAETENKLKAASAQALAELS